MEDKGLLSLEELYFQGQTHLKNVVDEGAFYLFMG